MLILELGVVLRLRDWRPSRLLALLDPLNCGISYGIFLTVILAGKDR